MMKLWRFLLSVLLLMQSRNASASELNENSPRENLFNIHIPPLLRMLATVRLLYGSVWNEIFVHRYTEMVLVRLDRVRYLCSCTKKVEHTTYKQFRVLLLKVLKTHGTDVSGGFDCLWLSLADSAKDLLRAAHSSANHDELSKYVSSISQSMDKEKANFLYSPLTGDSTFVHDLIGLQVTTLQDSLKVLTWWGLPGTAPGMTDLMQLFLLSLFTVDETCNWSGFGCSRFNKLVHYHESHNPNDDPSEVCTNPIRDVVMAYERLSKLTNPTIMDQENIDRFVQIVRAAEKCIESYPAAAIPLAISSLRDIIPKSEIVEGKTKDDSILSSEEDDLFDD